MSKSPRLPSPPPPTEIQIGPKSTSIAVPNHDKLLNVELDAVQENSKRRIRPGTRSANMATGLPIIPFTELDSAFQLQEHLKTIHYDCTRSQNDNSTRPISRTQAKMISTPPSGVDKALWLYELCRLLINKCNDLILGFLFDTPPCSASTCPEMRASEWQFLCAVHESPKSCCAIDYCCHTLDWATNIVTSQKIFPSRLSLGKGDIIAEGNAGVRHLANIFRRLHRIFAHAWFQHRQVYWSVESTTGLYTLFKIVCDTYDLMPAENYKLPPEAEGLESVEESRPVISILKSNPCSFSLTLDDDHINSIARNKTRRHIRQSPSVGSAVTTVLEADEDDTISQEIEDLSRNLTKSAIQSSLVVDFKGVNEGNEISNEESNTCKIKENLFTEEIESNSSEQVQDDEDSITGPELLRFEPETEPEITNRARVDEDPQRQRDEKHLVEGS